MEIGNKIREVRMKYKIEEIILLNICISFEFEKTVKASIPLTR